ncbi:MAG: Spore maturation protein B [Firmicutes bacterium ADurb.Bin193]|nr:MAG: Spore maturation protein B [Firmicutes bacterium ADurb.Bin193]
MMGYISAAIVPLMFFGIILFGFIKRVKIFESFVLGAKDGLETSFRILPSLVALLTAITMFRASGALGIMTDFLSPVLELVRFPKELAPLAFMRPISGSGSLAIVKDILSNYGPDSFQGRVASIMMGSTETTFYTLAIYFGCVNVKDTRYTVKAALLADLVAMLTSVYITRLFFY